MYNVSNNSIEPRCFRITATFDKPGSASHRAPSLTRRQAIFTVSKANTKKQTPVHVRRGNPTDNGLLPTPLNLFTHYEDGGYMCETVSLLKQHRELGWGHECSLRTSAKLSRKMLLLSLPMGQNYTNTISQHW